MWLNNMCLACPPNMCLLKVCQICLAIMTKVQAQHTKYHWLTVCRHIQYRVTHIHTHSHLKYHPVHLLTDKMCVWPRKTICVYTVSWLRNTDAFPQYFWLCVWKQTNTHTPHLVNGWTGCDSGCLFEPIPRPHTHTQTHTTVRSVVGGETGSYVHRPVCTWSVGGTWDRGRGNGGGEGRVESQSILYVDADVNSKTYPALQLYNSLLSLLRWWYPEKNITHLPSGSSGIKWHIVKYILVIINSYTQNIEAKLYFHV